MSVASRNELALVNGWDGRLCLLECKVTRNFLQRLHVCVYVQLANPFVAFNNLSIADC